MFLISRISAAVVVIAGLSMIGGLYYVIRHWHLFHLLWMIPVAVAGATVVFWTDISTFWAYRGLLRGLVPLTLRICLRTLWGVLRYALLVVAITAAVLYFGPMSEGWTVWSWMWRLMLVSAGLGLYYESATAHNATLTSVSQVAAGLSACIVTACELLSGWTFWQPVIVGISCGIVFVAGALFVPFSLMFRDSPTYTDV